MDQHDSHFSHYHNKNGPDVTAKLHSTKKSYLTAVRKARGSEGPSVANPSKWYGTEAHEWHFVRDGKQGVRVYGQQYLGDVITAGFSSLAIGQRTYGGVYPVSPGSLGGRLEVLSTIYQEHKALNFAVHYSPTVPATTAGAIAIFFQNDIGIQTNITGVEEFVHASNNAHFIQTQVWEEADLEIKPEDMVVKYADEETGDARLETQGLIQVVAAATLASGSAYGNLFLRYEFEFYASELDFEIDDVTSTTLSLEWPTAATTTVIGAPVLFEEGTGSATNTIYVNLTGVVAADLPNYLFIGILGGWGAGTETNSDDFPFDTRDDTASNTFDEGAAYWFRFTNEGDQIYSTMYLDMASASSIETDLGNGTAGQAIWSADAQASVTNIKIWFKGRLLRLGDSS